jgi:hypothetical protein
MKFGDSTKHDPTTKPAHRARIEAHTQKFLESGGKVSVIPTGVSGEMWKARRELWRGNGDGKSY